jgi:hypothetical protein
MQNFIIYEVEMGTYVAKNLDDALQYILSYADTIPFSHLTISLKPSDLVSPQYSKLLKHLKQYALELLNLVFSEEEINNREELAYSLLHSTLLDIHYPVVVYKKNLAHEITLDNDAALHLFYDQVIEKIQNQPQLITPENETSALDNLLEPDGLEHSTKFIQLKALIKKKKNSVMFDHLIRVEERLEIIEQHEEVEEVKETIEVQAQAQGIFDGDLIDFAKFHQPPYSNFIHNRGLYAVFEQELFGNLPKGIKYTSHEAALVLAKNAGAYVALNADNLPEGFILKKTPMGEFVLDYSQDAVEAHVGNAFTPKPAYSVSNELIYGYRKLPDHVLEELQSIGIQEPFKWEKKYFLYK